MKKLYFLIFATVISISVQAASLSFLVVHPGDGTSYTKSSNTITWTTTLSGSSFLFTSANPADVTFSGNDVAGQFSYFSNGQTYRINGVISRPQKTGNTANGFYFYETTVLGGNVPTGKAYLFEVPGRTVDASPSPTSSNPVGPELETLRQTESGLADPVITSNGGGTNAYLSISEGITSVTTVTGTVYGQTSVLVDGKTVVVPASTKTFSITGGADASKFTINPSTGVLTFNSAPDYENPTDAGANNVYDVEVTLTDSQGTTDVQTLAITITNINDNPPVITSNGGGSTATINVTAGTSGVTTVTATDADYGDVLTYSISGADASLFTIDTNSGLLVYKNPATVGTDKTVIVTVTDALGHTDTQTLTIHVTATDTTAPSLVITSSDSNLSAGEVCTISFKFSELVQGFTYSDVVVAGGTLGAITQSESDPTLYTASFTQSGSGAAPSFNVGAGTYQDLANNNGTSASLVLSYDVVPPTVAVTFGSADISYGETEQVIFTFSENPGNTFSLSDIVTENGTLTNLIQTANPLVWNATLQANSSKLSPVVTVQNHSYTDAAGNLGSSGTNTITLVPPSIDLENTSYSDTGVSSSDNITTNRKPIITGFVASGTATVTVTVQYYVASVLTTLTYNNVAVTNQIFNLNLNTTSPSTGTMPVDGLPEGYVLLNVTTPTSATASSQFLIDLTAPTPSPIANNLTTYDQTPTLTGTATVADGEVLTVIVNGVTYTNGDGYLTLNGTNWTLNVPIANKINPGSYTITAKVTDAAGNFSSGTGNLTINASTVTVDLANTSASDTGTSSTDNITSNRKPVITGTASGSDTTVKLTIVSGGVTYTYNSVAVSGGTYSLDLSTASPSSIVPTGSFPSSGLPTGTVNLTAEGNTSGAIGTNSFVIDYTAPTIPTVNYLSTTDTTPTITGTATVGAGDIFTVLVNGVTYTNGDGRLSYSSGNWTLNIPAQNELPINTYTVVATVKDAAGNSSSNSDTDNLVINPIPAEVQTYNIAASPTFTTANISWTNGSRASRVVFMKEGTGAITNPVNGTTYNASSNWDSKGTQSGTSGYYCIYKGSDASGSVNVTNLYPGRTYTIQAFEFNGSSGSEDYLTTETGSNNPNTVIPWPTTTFTNSNGVSTAETWNSAARWDHNTVPSSALHEAVLVYIDGNCEVTTDAECYNLTINAPHDGITPKLTIKSLKSMHVLGGALNGELTNNGGVNALVVKASASGANGTLLYHNSASNHVYASVEMYSKAFTDSKFHWPYFEICVKSQLISSTIGGYPERVRKYDESNKDPYNVGLWYPAGSTTTLAPGTTLIPVDGYEVTQPSEKTYTFKGELINEDIHRVLNYTVDANWAGQNIIANPYTAAIDISTLTFGPQTEPSVYLYNAGSLSEWEANGGAAAPGSNPGTYIVSTPFTAGDLGVPDQIPSMQGFLVNANSNSSDAYIDFHYSTSLTSNLRQQRVKSQTNSLKVATLIDVVGDKNSDRLWIFSDPSCTRNFDRGWDGKKFIAATTQIFAMEEDGDYQIDAISDINETYLGFLSGKDSNFKLIFTHQNLELKYSKLYLVDMVDSKLVDITANGTEYHFTAAPSTVPEKRFKIITQTTSVENSPENTAFNVYNANKTIFIKNLTGKSGKINMYNTAGVLVREFEIPANYSNVIHSDLEPGVYIAKSRIKNKEVIKSMIIN